jgi:hypothetical protein
MYFIEKSSLNTGSFHCAPYQILTDAGSLKLAQRLRGKMRLGAQA